MGLRKYSLFGGLALGVIAMGILLFWKGYNEEVDQSPFLQEAKSQEEKSLMQIGAMGAKARSLDETDTYADVFLQFDNWMNQYLLARTEGLRQKLLSEGVSLASRRRSLMKWLINENPELALSLAVSEEIQKKLPKEIAELLEKEVSGEGFYGVVAVDNHGAEGEEHFSGRISREVVFSDLTYRTHVYGRRLGLGTRESLLVHGVAIDGELALHEDPYQILEESPSGVFSGGRVVARVGDEVQTFESVEIFEEVAAALIEEEENKALPEAKAGEVNPVESWSTGEKTVFVFLVRPSDGEEWVRPPSQSELSAQLAVTSDWFKRTSYGKVWFAPEVGVTPIMDLPKTIQEYKNSFYQLQMDCRSAAEAAGFDPNAFDRWVVMSNSNLVDGAGLAYVEGKFSWVGGSLAGGVVTHEFGHNFGLHHGNFWESEDGVPRSPAGTHLEYGDVDESMAGVGGQEYNAYYRNRLGWLRQADGDVHIIDSSGTFRLFNNVDEFSKGLLRGIVIPVDDAVAYREMPEPYMHSGLKKLWVSYRKTTDWFGRGATLHVQGQNLDASQHRIDLTPNSKASDFSDMWDSALLIGRTYTETHNQFGGIHITPLGRGEMVREGKSHNWLDVEINLGMDEDNENPTVTLGASVLSVNPMEMVTLTANATDRNGDALAFSWSFDDGTFSSDNEFVQKKNWKDPGYYEVSVTVSDRRGGYANGNISISVGGVTPETMYSAGLILETPDGDLFVEEGGAEAPYSVVLKRKPDQPVTVLIRPDSQVSTSVDSLIFMPNEWNRPQSITVEGVDDAEREAKAHSGEIRHVVLSEDVGYKSLAEVPLSVEVFDNDCPTINVTAGPGLAENISGTDSWFRVQRSGASSTTIDEDEIVTFRLVGTASFAEGDFVLYGDGVVVLANGLSGSVRIPAGSSEAFLSVMANDDNLPEGYERIVLSIEPEDSYQVGEAKSAFIKIEDNDSIDSFTEQFGYSGEGASLFDLNDKTVTLIPGGSDSFYRAYTDQADGFPTTALEEVLLVDDGVLKQSLLSGGLDDGYWSVQAPTSFYGIGRTELFISTNGQITFESGDSSYMGILSDESYFLSGRPRLALSWGDLNPSEGGKISYARIEDPDEARFVVRYEDVPVFAGAGEVSAQVEIWENGKITMTWLESPSIEVLVGLSAGVGFPGSFSESDLSGYRSLGKNDGEGDVPLSISPFDVWKREQFVSLPGGADGPEAGDLSDPDGDGIVNLLEFAFAADALEPDLSRLPQISVEENPLDGKNYLEITYRQRIGGKGVVGVSYKVDGLLYKVEVSESLESGSWNSGSDLVEQIGESADNRDGTETVTVRVLQPVSDSGKKFACVRVTMAE
jgi:hypothetical protein